MPQRRRRVFVVGHLGDGAGVRQVLALAPRGPRDFEARGEARSHAAGGTRRSAAGNRRTVRRLCVTGHRTHTLTGEGHDAGKDGTGRGVPPVARCLTGSNQRIDAETETFVVERATVRRLTPRECERLQGMPDDWTLIPWRGKPADECPGGPRYKAIGNSMAVPVMRWIGKGIQDAT